MGGTSIVGVAKVDVEVRELDIDERVLVSVCERFATGNGGYSLLGCVPWFGV